MNRTHETPLRDTQGPQTRTNERVRLKVLVPLSIGLLLLTCVAVAVRYDQYESTLDSEATERSTVVSAFVQHDLQENSDLMVSLLQGLSGNPELSTAFLAGDRELLIARATPFFNDMHGKRHIAHFYFHDLEGRVFLRMHAPESFGDVIQRETLKETASTGEASSGFERGPMAMFAQRTVWPWEVDGKRIGYLELSMNLEATTKGLSNQLDMEMFVVVDKALVDRATWETGQKNYGGVGDWSEFEDVVVMERTTQTLAAPMTDYLRRPATEAPYETLELDDGRVLIAQTIPLRDLHGNALARMAVFTDVSDVAAGHQRALLFVFVVSALISLLLFGFFFIFFGRVEKKLVSKREALEKSNATLALEVDQRRNAQEALKVEHDQLEARVLARTKELQEANEALKGEITARTAAVSEVDRLFNAATEMIAIAGFDGFFKRVNPAMIRALGYTEYELLHTPFIEFCHPDDVEATGRYVAAVARHESVPTLDLRVKHKDGHYLQTEWNDTALSTETDFYTIGRDVTQRKQAERHLLEANTALKAEVEARTLTQTELDQLFIASLDLLTLGSVDGTILRVNPSFCAAFGYSPEDLVGKPFANFVPPEDKTATIKLIARVSRGETINGLLVRIVTKDGRIRNTEWNLVPFIDRGMFYATGRDITDRLKLEESLRAALAGMKDAQRIGMVGSWSVDFATGTSDWSDETFRILGMAPGEIMPHLDAFYEQIHPDDIQRVRKSVKSPLASGEQRRQEYRLLLKDGRVRDIVAVMELLHAPDGSPLRLHGTCQDVTDQRNAEQNQGKLQDQLRASQKMEAIGSLAGGIAHDFNNLLSVILSYVGFVMDALPIGDARRNDLMEVQKAAERAAGLTRQLLAFGRKQVLQPVPLNLNKVAASMENMLHRLIGEDITLVQRLDPALGATMADPGQVEQVIMNLVVNSKDAMPNGGRLSMETANFEFYEDQVTGLKAGPYVMLAVTDTGSGMDADTKARVFEPFFTTKEVGKGTGLGLPTAYGIAKQSGGNITVYSELGVGSTFRVYLPRNASEVAPTTDKIVCAENTTGSETIMVVEDEAGVRNSARRILGTCGYNVLTAENGVDALEKCNAHEGDIDLVLTDVVMPKMSGAAFAVELARVRPQTRILFMSGYSGDAIVHQGILDAGTQFIGKPFSAGDLTRKVREMLDTERDAYPTDPTDVAPLARGAL
jgi:PAS domain S-box-containing protein